MLRGIINRISQELIVPDRILAFSAIVIGAVLLAVAVLKVSPIALLLAILIGLPGGAWILTKGRTPLGAGFHLSDDLFFAISGSFFLVLALTIASFALRDLPYARPFQVFLFVPLLVALTALTALGANRIVHHALCLTQSVCIGLLLSISQIALFPGVIGIDPWFHQALTTAIAQAGFLPSDPNFAGYVHFPVMHLSIAGMQVMTDLPYNLAAFLTASVPIILVNCIFVYLLAKELLPGRQAVALLAALLVVINPSHIFMTYVVIPNGFAVIFVLPALYLLYRSSGKLSRESTAVLVLILGTLILTHTVTAVFMAVILFLVWAVFHVHARLGQPAPCFTVLVPILFAAGLLAWWMIDTIALGTIIDLIANRFSIDYFKPDELANLPKPVTMLSWHVLVDRFTSYLFLFLPLLGMFFMFSKRGTRLTYTHALLGLVPLAIVSLSYVMPVTTLEDRWLYFAALLNGAAMAITLLLFQGGFSRLFGGRSVLSVAVLSGIICFAGAVASVNPIASVDFHPTAENDETSPVVLSEIVAVSTVRDVWDRPIWMDHYYFTTQRWVDPEARDFTLNLYDKNFTEANQDLVLIRESARSPDYLYSFVKIPYYDVDSTLRSSGFSLAYDAGTVRGYRGTARTLA